MKKLTLPVLLFLTAFTVSACGSNSVEPTVEQAAGADVAQSTDAVEADSSTDEAWSTDGVFIDEQGNYLILVYYSEEEGMGQYGWTISAILEDEMYGGFVDDVSGALKGDIMAYGSDGNVTETKTVTLTYADPYVVMQTDSGEEYQFTADDTDYTADIGDLLPMYQYQSIYAYDGFDNLWAAAYNYLSFDVEELSDLEHVLIPYVNIVDVDDSDPEDVLVYGDYYLWEFEQIDDTLCAVSSSHIPGIIHMTQIGEGDVADYYGNSMDQGLTDDEVEELFGEYYEHYLTITSDDDAWRSGMATIIADYVKANSLSITKYQLDGDSALDLPESYVKVYRETAGLPEYEYPDTTAKEYAIYQYILQSYYSEVDTSLYDVTIPYVYIFAEDDSDEQDIVVMFSGFIASYNLEDDVLKMQSGSEITGAIHLEKTSDGYEATSLDTLLDGSEYEKSAKEIFGSYYDDFTNLSDDDLAEVEKQVISDYVNMNDLSITGYQDLGSELITID